jgi:cyclopropane fatty-acyl-phospholipid synthase-like methyltransferase
MTDKFVLGYFYHIYYPMFALKRLDVKSVLEIGVGEGRSLEEWASLFPNATVHGVDLRMPSKNPSTERITINLGNAYTPEVVSGLQAYFPNGYDLIIDDGPHTIESQKYFLTNYLPLLSNKGVAVLEDIIEVNRLEELTACIPTDLFEYKVIDMTGKIFSPELAAHWANSLSVITVMRRPPIKKGTSKK